MRRELGAATVDRNNRLPPRDESASACGKRNASHIAYVAGKPPPASSRRVGGPATACAPTICTLLFCVLCAPATLSTSRPRSDALAWCLCMLSSSRSNALRRAAVSAGASLGGEQVCCARADGLSGALHSVAPGLLCSVSVAGWSDACVASVAF